MKTNPLPPAELLNELFSYDPDTGVLTWAARQSKKCPIGSRAGTLNRRGYSRVSINRLDFMIHRVIWCMVTGNDPGSLQIDHINGMKSDNRWCNLRLATRNQNSHNTGSRHKSMQCPKGVRWSVTGLKWVVTVGVNRGKGYRGLFEDIDEAEAVARAIRESLHGDFANHGSPISESHRNSLKLMQKTARAEMDAKKSLRRDNWLREVARRRLASALKQGFQSYEEMVAVKADRKAAWKRSVESYNPTTQV